MFRAHVLIIMRSKLHYTVSGIITPIGVMIPEASSWLNTEINVLRCTVNKTSKYPVHVSNIPMFIIRRFFLYTQHTVFYLASTGFLAANAK